jgi:hypothetical protein
MSALQENIRLIEEQNELFKELILLRMTLEEQNKKIEKLENLLNEHNINVETGEQDPNIIID